LTSGSEPSAPKSNAASSAREAPAGDAAVPRLELADWADRHGVVAGITTRGQGAAGFSLGLWSDEPVGQVLSRWRAFCAAFAPRFPTVVLSHQIHGTRVDWHDAPPLPNGWLVLDGLDGHATTAPGLLLTVTVADCIPVYLVVPHKGAIALLHAGWRGVAAGVLERGIEGLKWRGFAKASEIVMHCGVGICGTCYEVGSEVALRFGVVSGSAPVHLDLRSILVDQARRLGVEQISVSPWCTAHDRGQFFSHRASGGRDGRMVAYLGRPQG
jgi:purine-nucleoside/S-methyl-5'-thioadenosine phosphorylase / adenosine deaminase